MGRGWKILIGALVAIVVLIVINALVSDAETKSAEVTQPGGQIVRLPGGDLEVTDRGPRAASAIVLIHCFTCAIDWWDRMMPRLALRHRVVAVDLLGHGGSEAPTSGYGVPNQADLVAGALGRLGVRNAVVVGHSLGGTVAVALAQQSPRLVKKVVIVDSGPNRERGDLGFLAKLPFAPVIGPALWRIKPDFSVRDGLEVAFAPGFDVPDAFVENVKRMTYNAYHDSASESDDYVAEESLDTRMKRSGQPLLVIMGAEEQIIDEPERSLAEYRANVPGVQTKLIQGSGHSPNVERPALTGALVLDFARSKRPANQRDSGARVQEPVQKREAVRSRP